MAVWVCVGVGHTYRVITVPGSALGSPWEKYGSVRIEQGGNSRW